MEVAQGGSWRGENHFAVGERAETGTCFETIQFEEGGDYPEPDEWFPVAPVASTEVAMEESKSK